MPHVVNGILRLSLTDTSNVAQIDQALHDGGFDVECIHSENKSGITDYYIDQCVSIHTTPWRVLETITKIDGVTAGMWISNKAVTEPYEIFFNDDISEEVRMSMITEFFNQQKKLIENELEQYQPQTTPA